MARGKVRPHRPSAESVMCKWRMLSPCEQRQVMTFNDRFLVSCIADALQTIHRHHQSAAAAGLQPYAKGTDPFKSSLVLEAFSFTCQGQCGSEDPSIAVLATDTLVMKIKAPFLQGEDFFEQLRRVLPDFLSPRYDSKRVPLPVPYWKQLWENAPSSFANLEQQLAKTVEQALWAMASDPRLGAQRAEPMTTGAEFDEAWMDEEEPASKPTKASTKTRKKKRKQKGNRANCASQDSTNCPSDASQVSDIEDLVAVGTSSEQLQHAQDLAAFDVLAEQIQDEQDQPRSEICSGQCLVTLTESVEEETDTSQHTVPSSHLPHSWDDATRHPVNLSSEPSEDFKSLDCVLNQPINFKFRVGDLPMLIGPPPGLDRPDGAYAADFPLSNLSASV